MDLLNLSNFDREPSKDYLCEVFIKIGLMVSEEMSFKAIVHDPRQTPEKTGHNSSRSPWALCAQMS